MTQGQRSGGGGKFVLLAVVLSLLTLLAVAFFSRSLVATKIARGALEERGITCESSFEVQVQGLFSAATLSPTRCTFDEMAGRGLLEEIELLEPVEIELSGMEPSRVSAGQIELRLGSSASESRGWSRELQHLGVEAAAAGMVKALSSVGAMQPPPTTATQIGIRVGSTTLGQIRGLTLGAGTPMEVEIESLSFGRGGGLGQLSLSSIQGDASATEVHLRGQAGVRIPILGTVIARPFSLSASGMNTARPSFEFEGSL